MKTRHYTPEIKDRAVRMLIEALNDYTSMWSTIQVIVLKIESTFGTLWSCHKKRTNETILTNIQD